MYSGAYVSTYDAVADVAERVRKENSYALERAEDIETLNDFYEYLLQQ